MKNGGLDQDQLVAYALDIKSTYDAEKNRAEELASALAELRRTYYATVRGLSVAVEAKDEYTAGHLARVRHYGLAMMTRLAPDLLVDHRYEYGFLLHDIGKIGVPDAILRKNGPLNGDEWTFMRLHPEIGIRILKGIPFLRDASEIVYSHHERWDGRGYPHGLKGDEIPLGAKVFSVADSFDAMTSDRPYRSAMPIEDALEELEASSGSQLWPTAVETFLSLPVEEIEEVVNLDHGQRDLYLEPSRAAEGEMLWLSS
jgi:HD-GYP domain-containing protein (c-di-GMP phosphodiesterase class II)